MDSRNRDPHNLASEHLMAVKRSPQAADRTPAERSGFAYQRVSTAGQDPQLQRTSNLRYAADMKIPIHDEATDTASGASPWANRGLGRMLELLPPFTDVIVYELSRIGRDLADTLLFLRECAERNINVHISRTAMKIGAGIDGKIFATVLGLAAEIERDFIISRTTDALAEIKQSIKTHGSFTSKSGHIRTSLGRPKGTTRLGKLASSDAEIDKLLAASVSVSAIARILHVNRSTIARYQARKSLIKATNPTQTELTT